MTAAPLPREAGPPLARVGVDRAATRRTDPEWLAAAWRRARVLVVDPTGRARCVVPAPGGSAATPEPGGPAAPGGSAAAPEPVSAIPPELVFVDAAAAPAGDRLFLGVAPDGTPYFAVVAELPAHPAAAVTLREVGATLSDRDAELFLTAVALANWHAGHPYAPTTGEPTRPAGGGWVRVDGAGQQLFPRTDPAVIVLVHDGVAGPEGRCLLGHNAAWRSRPGGRRFFSTLAGFVEPGESAESAVVREVREEVGIEVSGLRYQGSQPWPFRSSLMLGFTGSADPGAPLRPDPSEIVEARWFTRAEVAGLLSDRPDPDGAPYGESAPGSEIALPGPASIAHYLISLFRHSSRRL